jgi:hypothetical protein
VVFCAFWWLQVASSLSEFSKIGVFLKKLIDTDGNMKQTCVAKRVVHSREEE